MVNDVDCADNMIMGWLHGEGDQFIDFNVRKVEILNSDGELEEAYAIDPNVQCNVHKCLRKRKIDILKNVNKEVAA